MVLKRSCGFRGDRTHRVTAASEVALKALFLVSCPQDGLQSLNISGRKFTEKFIEIFSDLLTLSKLTSLTITIDDAAFLKQFADESVIYLPNLKQVDPVCGIGSKSDGLNERAPFFVVGCERPSRFSDRGMGDE